MDPLSIIALALVAGAAASAKDVAAQAVKDGYAGLKALIVRKWGSKADVEASIQQVEKKPEAESRQQTLKEELKTAGVDQDEEVLKLAQAMVELLKQHDAQTVATYSATVIGSGAIAQGPGAVAAGKRGAVIGHSAQGNVIVTGSGNIVGSGNQVGGIRANKIEAENVVDGMQMLGGDAQAATELVDLAKAIQRGGISAEEIKAKNLVSGLQYISDPAKATPDELRQEVAALRKQLDVAIKAGEIADKGEAEDAQDALQKAEQAMAEPQPQGSRVTRKLGEVTDILIRAADMARAAGRVGLEIIKLAPVAATLKQVAERLFGG